MLRECYGDKDAVTDELVDFILKPGLEVRVFDMDCSFIASATCCQLTKLVGYMVLSVQQFLSLSKIILPKKSQLFKAQYSRGNGNCHKGRKGWAAENKLMPLCP